MTRLVLSRSAVILLMFCMLAFVPAELRAADRTPPSAPKQLRVTGTTHYSVSLTWSPSSDNSGTFSYVIKCNNGYSMTAPQTATSAVFSTALYGGVTYSFNMYAVDGSGNRSKNSNSVTVSLPTDTIPPTAPVVTVTDTGPTHVSLAWSATDDGPYLYYTVYKDGIAVLKDTRATSYIFNALQPTTTYTFTVKARDNANNQSPLSAPTVVTTEAIDTSDTTPPTTPTDLWESHYANDPEVTLFWTQSTDNTDIQAAIRYEVYLNGALSDITLGSGQSLNYLVPGTNNFSVFAVDTAGNTSAPATITIEF